MIAWALDHRLVVILIALGSLVSAVVLQAGVGGTDFAPVSDRGEISLVVETPPGSSLDYTREKVNAVTELVRSHPEVRYTYSALGTPMPMRAPGVDQALIYVSLAPKQDRKVSQEQLGATLRQELSRIGGTTVSVFTSGFGGRSSSWTSSFGERIRRCCRGSR